MRLVSTRREGWILVLASLAVSFAMLHRRMLPLDAFPAVAGNVDNDCFQGVWNLWFASEALLHGRNPYHTDSIYAPIGANLAHHTLTPGFAPLTWLVRLVTGGAPLAPLYAYNIVPLVGFAALLAATFWLLRSLGFARMPSSIGAVAYAFGRFHMHHIIHPNYIADFCIPICFALLARLYSRPSLGRALAAGAAAGLSVYFTEAALYMYLAILLTIALAACFAEGRRGLYECARRLRARGVAALVLVPILLAAPYAHAVLGDTVLRPSLAEAQQYSSNILGLFVPDPRTTPLYGSLFAGLTRHMLVGLGGSEIFLGFVSIGLAIVALVALRRRALVRVAGILTVVFLILSMGPAFGLFDDTTWVPLPYALLGRLPVFGAGRTPVRFLALAALYLSVLAAAGMTWIDARLGRSRNGRWGRAVAAMLLLWCAAETVSPAPERVRFVVPAAVLALPHGTVLNLPPREKDGYAAMLQILHGQPIATGYTARISLERLMHVRRLRRAFDKGGPDFWPLLTRLGYRSVVVTPEWITPRASLAPLGPAPPTIAVVDLRETRTDSDCDAPSRTSPMPLAGGRIHFADPRGRYLCFGWGDAESDGRWSVRGEAALVFARGGAEFRRLQFAAAPFLVPGRCARQRVSVELNGVPLGDWVLDQPGPQTMTGDIPSHTFRPVNELVFRLPDAESPLAVHWGADHRTLAIKVAWVQFATESTE